MTAPNHAPNERFFDLDLDSAAKKSLSGFIGDINRYQPTLITNASHLEAFKAISNLLDQIRGPHDNWDAWFRAADDKMVTKAFNDLVDAINDYAIVKKGTFGKESDLFKAKDRLVQAQQKLIKEQQEHIDQLEQRNAALRKEAKEAEDKLQKQQERNVCLASQNARLSGEKETLSSENLELSKQVGTLQTEQKLAIQDRDTYKSFAEKAAERESKAQEKITAVEKHNLALTENIQRHIGQVEQTGNTVANLQAELSQEKARSAELEAENKVFKSWVSELAGILSKFSAFIKPIFGEEKARKFENFLKPYVPCKATFWGNNSNLNDVVIKEDYDPAVKNSNWVVYK